MAVKGLSILPQYEDPSSAPANHRPQHRFVLKKAFLFLAVDPSEILPACLWLGVRWPFVFGGGAGCTFRYGKLGAFVFCGFFGRDRGFFFLRHGRRRDPRQLIAKNVPNSKGTKMRRPILFPMPKEVLPEMPTAHRWARQNIV